MKHVTVQEAQAQLETLLESGETVEILRDGKVIARLEPEVAKPVQPVPAKIDVSALRAHQARLTSPVQDTQRELDEWKAESRY